MEAERTETTFRDLIFGRNGVPALANKDRYVAQRNAFRHFMKQIATDGAVSHAECKFKSVKPQAFHHFLLNYLSTVCTCKVYLSSGCIRY